MSSSSSSFNLNIDLRVVALLLVVSNLVMLFLWQPWGSSSGSDTRTIKTSGQATLTATPDKFVFYPSYEFSGADNDAVNQKISAKSDEVVEGLKGIGAQDKDIKTDASSYQNFWQESPDGDIRGFFSLTVTADNQEFAQTVSDYLITTSPQGQITPQAEFSTAKQKQLEDEARSLAIANARNSAERTATDLGVNLGDVRSVSDSENNFLPWFGYGRAEIATLDAAATPSSVSVQPGQNELTFSVDVIFEVE